MEQKEIRYKGSRISYLSRGEGQPVILVHGFGEDGTVWRSQLDALKDYHLIVPDLPGSGKSEMIGDMSLEAMADVLEALIRHELATIYFKEGDPGSVVMIGHSMGGYITLAFAEKYHHMLRGFGLFHSTAYADNEEKKQTRRKGIDFIRQHGGFEFLKSMVPNLYCDTTRAAMPQLLQEHLVAVSNFSGEALVNYYEAMIARPDRTAALKTWLPVFFMIGKKDTVVSPDDAIRQSHIPQSSYIHILERSAHMGMLEEPEETTRHLLKYLEYVVNAT